MTEREIADLTLRLNNLERTVETQMRYLRMLARHQGYWLSEQADDLILLRDSSGKFDCVPHVVDRAKKP